MQVLHPGLSHSGKEALTEQQPDLSHLGRQQGHNAQGDQDGGQRKDRAVEQQLGFGETLLLKQGYGVGEVSLAFFSPHWDSKICYYLKRQKSKQ